MTYLRALILERDQRSVLRELGHLGLLQLTFTKAGPDTAPLAPRDQTQKLADCEQMLRRIESLSGTLPLTRLSATSAAAVTTSLDESQYDLKRIEGQTNELLTARQKLVQGANELAGLDERLANYEGLDLPFDCSDRFSFLHFVAGTVPAAKLPHLEKLVGDKVALVPLAERNSRRAIIAMTTRSRRLQLQTALQKVGFQQEKLFDAGGSATIGFSMQRQREQQKITEELQNVEAKLLSFSTEAAPVLEKIHNFVETEKRLLEALQNFPRTDAAVLLTGWVPAAAAAKLEQRIRTTTRGVCAIEFATPERVPQEEAPVLLRHGRLFRPFQKLLSAFGLPKYEEIEPTLFVAVIYLLMFGMMFGDAGHGAVLALIGVAALIIDRTSKLRDFGVMILFAGFSSIGFGLLSGSCFGLPQFKRYALWHDPIEGNPLSWIYAAILFGIIILSLGLILNVINHFRRRDVLRGLLDRFGIAGLVFYWGVLVLIARFAAIRSHGLLVPVIIVSVVMPLAGWIISEPIQHVLSSRRKASGKPRVKLAALFTYSVVSSFEAMLSYLANTISFVRLAAYAMSHAALVLAILLVAGEVKHFGVLGEVTSILLIVVGNLIAIALEGIIASVQTLRLEYYEFFSKFFSASGQPFKAFCLGENWGLPAIKKPNLAHALPQQ